VRISVIPLLIGLSVSAWGQAYPLKLSANHRYLADQNNIPFLITGDSPQAMTANISATNQAGYMADRERHGFNTILVMALTDSYINCPSSGANFYGTLPFTSGSDPSNYDLSTPNEAYFSNLDRVINLAKTYNLAIFLDPIETGGWLVALENNGPAKAFNYGAYLGSRYKNFPNIVWSSGNDFQTWNSSPTDNNLVYQVMAGIASTDPNHLQTIELNYDASYSNQDTAKLGPVLTLDSSYTYYDTYDMDLQAYASSPTIPMFLTEANYEFENNTGALPGPAGVFALRLQEYWTMTSGGTGQLYGNHYTWGFFTGWQAFLDSPGALEIQYLVKFFNRLPWWNLVPDTAHQVVTAGYGTYTGSELDIENSDYCTVAWVTDGTHAVAYCPTTATLTVNLAEMSGKIMAWWYDPSSGMYSAIPGSPFLNRGTHNFSTPGANRDGNTDWLLYLDTIGGTGTTM
jgi:hypothetical protein